MLLIVTTIVTIFSYIPIFVSWSFWSASNDWFSFCSWSNWKRGWDFFIQWAKTIDWCAHHMTWNNSQKLRSTEVWFLDILICIFLGCGACHLTANGKAKTIIHWIRFNVSSFHILVIQLNHTNPKIKHVQHLVLI